MGEIRLQLGSRGRGLFTEAIDAEDMFPDGACWGGELA